MYEKEKVEAWHEADKIFDEKKVKEILVKVKDEKKAKITKIKRK